MLGRGALAIVLSINCNNLWREREEGRKKKGEKEGRKRRKKRKIHVTFKIN